MKKNTTWEEALDYALANYEGRERDEALADAAKKLIAAALEGDIQAIKEIANALDGEVIDEDSEEHLTH